jgi:hypothetical protein
MFLCSSPPRTLLRLLFLCGTCFCQATIFGGKVMKAGWVQLGRCHKEILFFPAYLKRSNSPPCSQHTIGGSSPCHGHGSNTRMQWRIVSRTSELSVQQGPFPAMARLLSSSDIPQSLILEAEPLRSSPGFP